MNPQSWKKMAFSNCSSFNKKYLVFFLHRSAGGCGKIQVSVGLRCNRTLFAFLRVGSSVCETCFQCLGHSSSENTETQISESFSCFLAQSWRVSNMRQIFFLLYPEKIYPIAFKNWVILCFQKPMSHATANGWGKIATGVVSCSRTDKCGNDQPAERSWETTLLVCRKIKWTLCHLVLTLYIDLSAAKTIWQDLYFSLQYIHGKIMFAELVRQTNLFVIFTQFQLLFRNDVARFWQAQFLTKIVTCFWCSCLSVEAKKSLSDTFQAKPLTFLSLVWD